MKQTRNRILSLVLTLAMVLTMLPLGTMKAAAAGEAVTLGGATKAGGTNQFKLEELTVSGLDTADVSLIQVTVTGGTVKGPGTGGAVDGWTSLPIIGNTSLTLTATGKKGTDAQTALRTLLFDITGATMTVDVMVSTKTTTISAGAGSMLTPGADGHYYMFVSTASNGGNGGTTPSWSDAYAAAKKNTFMGMKGYLATITSEAEDQLLTAISKAGAWSGGAALSTESDDGNTFIGTFGGSDFQWACGPEANGTATDTVYYNSRSAGDSTNTAYNKWNNNEPNSTDQTNEHCMQVNYLGQQKWNDMPDEAGTGPARLVWGYFVEFGGYTNDPGGTVTGADYKSTQGSFTASNITEKPTTVALTVNPGKGMTLTNGSQNIVPGAITEITVTPIEGYTLPDTYDMGSGLQFTKNSNGTGKVTGSITGDVTVTIKGATGISLGEFTPSSNPFTLSNADVSVGGGVTALQVTVTGGTVNATAPSGWTALSNYGNTSLTLYGTSPKNDADATSLLQALTFKGTSTSMTIKVTAATKITNITSTGDRKLTAGANGHYYMYVPSSNTSWIASYNAAKGNTFMGMQGYLATITSKAEDNLLTSISTKGAWSGGAALKSNSGDNSTAPTDFGGSDFQWACGPEANTIYYTSRWHDIKNDATDVYNNWYRQTEEKYGEPNNGNSNNVKPDDDWTDQEPCMQVNFGDATKAWNDVPETGKAGGKPYTTGYFVEFGGYTDPKKPDPGYEASKNKKDYTATKTFTVDLSNTWKVAITLGTNMTAASDGGALSQSPTKGQPITTIKLTANTGYTMPETWDVGGGLTYTRDTTDHTIATIMGTPTAAVMATVPDAVGNSYHVKYEAHEGVAVANTDHTYGTSVELAQTTREGYTFNGWFDAPTGGKKVTHANNLTAVNDATVTLHAQWTIEQFSTKITAGANTTVSGDAVKTVDYDTPVTITVQAAEGYTLPKTWTPTELNGLVYARTDFDTATISGNLKKAVTVTAPAGIAIPTHAVTYTGLTGLVTDPAGATSVSEKDATLSFTLKPETAGQAVLPADVSVKVGATALTKTGATAKYEYSPVTGVVKITYACAEMENGFTGFDGDVSITAKAVVIPQITVEPGTGGVGTQIKVFPDLGTEFVIDKVVIGTTAPGTELKAPYTITPDVLTGLGDPATITVTITGPDGITIITKTQVAVTTLDSATKNTASSGKAVAAGGVTSATNPAVDAVTKPFISVTPIKTIYITVGVSDGTGVVTTDKETTFAQANTVLTATPKAGAYFDGFYVGDVKVTATNVETLVGTGASLSENGKVLTYKPSGKDIKITASYRNLLGEVNAAGSTSNDIDAVLKSVEFGTVFDATAELTAYNDLAAAKKIMALKLLDKLTPTPNGYAVDTFKATLVNVTALCDAADTAGKLNGGDYTEGTWAELEAAKAEVNALLSAETVTEAQITAAKNKLTAAINALQWKTLTLLIKSQTEWLPKIIVENIRTSKVASPAGGGGRRATAGMHDLNAMDSRAYFPVIGTGATIKIAKSDLTSNDVFAATVNGSKKLDFTLTGEYYVAKLPAINASTTVLITFAKKRVEVVLPTLTDATVSTNPAGTAENGETLKKNLLETILVTVKPAAGKMIMPGTLVKVTITPDEVLPPEQALGRSWNGAVTPFAASSPTDYNLPIGSDGVIEIPGTTVKGKVEVGSLSAAVIDITKETVEFLVTGLSDKYKDIQKDYTPESIDLLNKSIAAAKEVLKKTAPTEAELENAYQAVLTAEKGLKKQLAVALPNGILPLENKGGQPSDWEAKYKTAYGAGTVATYVAPGVVKVVTESPAKTEYFVREGYSVKLEGTATAADKTVSKVTYNDGTSHEVVTQQGAGTKYTFTIPAVTLPITSITATETGKAIVIIPGKITGPDTLNPGTVTGGAGGGTGETTVDPGKGGMVTEITVDKKVITLPTEELLKQIKEEIKKEDDKVGGDGLTENEVITPNPAIPGIDGGIKITGITGTSPNVTAVTGEVTLKPSGNTAKITVNPDTGEITVIKVLPKISTPANPDVDDIFKEITVDPGTGKATVTFPDGNKDTHEVGGKIDHKVHPLPTGEVKFPSETVIGTITSKNEPALPGIDPNKGIENRDVVVTITPKAPNEVLTGGGIKYVVTDPVTGVETPTTITLPGNATTGTAVVDPDTGVITVTIPGEKVTGEITFPDLGKNIVDPDTKKLDDLLGGAEELLKQKDKGTFVPAAPADTKWDAIDKNKSGIAKDVKDIIDAVKNGTSPAPTEGDKKKAIDDLNKAIKEITDTRNDVSTIPDGKGTPPKPNIPDIGTGVTNPGVITTPGTGGTGDTDKKLTLPDDTLVITGITTDPGFVPDKVVVTVIDPVTGKETKVEIPLVPGESGNLTGTSPYTATVPGTNPATATPAVTGGTNLKTILEKLKPGDIAGITVVGKKDGSVTLPTGAAIKDASNVLTGNTNSSGTSAGVTEVVLDPANGVVPKDGTLKITATLGKDDYSKTGAATATDRTYDFAGVKVDGKVLLEGTDYTVDTVTTKGKAIITFTKEQVTRAAGADGTMGTVEVLTTPTNPQYETFVKDYAKLDTLYKNYMKPDATDKDKAAFEELVSKLDKQLTETGTELAKTEQLTPDNKEHLANQKAQVNAYDSTIKSKKAAADNATAIDELYKALNNDTTAAGDPLPAEPTVTPDVAAAILKHQAEIEAAKNDFDRLTPAQQNQVPNEQQTKLSDAVKALTAAVEATKTKTEIAKELIGKLPSPANILKDTSNPKAGLKDKTSNPTDGANNVYGVDSAKATTSADNGAALSKLSKLNLDLTAAEAAAKAEGASITVTEQKKLTDLRTAVNQEYKDYAELFAKEYLTDGDNTVGSPAVDGAYPANKIAKGDWIKYQDELTETKNAYDKLPAKAKENIDKVMAPDKLDTIYKEVFPDLNSLGGVDATTILGELDKDPTGAAAPITVADLSSVAPVAPSTKTGPEWAESILKTYEKYQKLTPEEQQKVNASLGNGNKMEDLIAEAKKISPSSEENKTAANNFITKHLTENGAIITKATVANQYKIIGGETDWGNLTLGAQKAIDAALKAKGGSAYQALLADAKAFGSGSSGGNTDSGSGGGSTSTVKVTIEPGKNGTASINPKNPKPGQEVTITVNPDKGYKVSSVTITDKNGKELPKLGNNPYTIIAPEGGFIVKSKFVKADGSDYVGPFTDVPADAWYAPAVTYVYDEKLFMGTAADMFGPAVTMTRGMFVTILGRLAKVDVTKWTMGSKFSDVDADMYYAPYVAWGVSEGVIKGYSAERYCPEKLVTREEMAAILYRYVQKNGTIDQTKAKELAYTDKADISDWALDAVTWCTGEKVLAGRGNNILAPSADATRAEVAQMMFNFCHLKK